MAAQRSDPSEIVTEVLKVNTPNYNGGLTRADRGIADQIHTALLSRYYTNCRDPNPNAGVLVSLGNNAKEKELPLLDRIDPDLAFLIRALDNPNQEVRDVAAYTIALLGPSANAAQPFLERKFRTRDVKGGWYNFALENVSCQPISSPGVRDAIPDTIRSTGSLANASDQYVVASLYLDRDVEFPPGLLRQAFEHIGKGGDNAGPSLIEILKNDAYGVGKQTEAAEALSELDESYTKEALPALIHLADSDDDRLRYFVGRLLVRLHHERAIGLLIEMIHDESWDGDWDTELCEFGAKAIVAEDKLIEASRRPSVWSSVAQKIVETLGCLNSRKAIPTLTSMLDAPDWQLNIAAAKALGKIGQPGMGAIEALKRLSVDHWSARMRKAAFNALVNLGANPTPMKFPDHVKDDADPEIIGGPYPFDHGLPWCDETGKYSIDGKSWFMVKWIKSTLEAVPRGFRPKTDLLIQTVGTQSFLRVGDGWLFGSDGFESEGVLAHVSDSGVVTEMESEPGSPFGHASTVGIVRVKGQYFALSYEILKVGPAGVLLELRKGADGKWSSRQVLVLPSPPGSHAIAPSGELLLSDGPNDYAIVQNQIVPLKCEKMLPGSYFAGQ
jgi:HEAT repeat protein